LQQIFSFKNIGVGFDEFACGWGAIQPM